MSAYCFSNVQDLQADQAELTPEGRAKKEGPKRGGMGDPSTHQKLKLCMVWVCEHAFLLRS